MYTVLIADDEKIERNGIRRLLNKEKDSYRILEAEDGREAEKIIREDKVDILLTDIRRRAGLYLKAGGSRRV